MEILNPKEEQSLESAIEDTVQEQSRDYLDDEQYQQRTDTLTDREVLEMASNEIKMSDLSQAELDALTIFQDRLSNLKDLQEKRAEQGRLYKEQQFGTKVDRAKASETLNRMHVLDSQIKKATADVLTVEEKEVLKRVLQKARKVVEVQERQHGQEILTRWRDRRKNADNIKKYRERLRGDVDELTNWIIAPNNKDIVKHVPDVLKNSVIPFLSSINFMSKRSLKGGNATKADEAFMDRLKRLNAALKTNIDASGLYSGYNDLPPNFMENLQTFIESTEALVKNNSGEIVINQMTSKELKDLCTIVRTLKKYIMQVNRFHNNAMYQHVYEAGDNSIDFLKELDSAGEKTGDISNFLFWQQIRPAYAFERFGKGGEAIYDGLRRGQAKLAFNTKEIESFTKKAYTGKEVKAWEDEIKTFQFGSDTVKIPVSYIMGLYELYKDPDGKRHIDEGGIRVATYTHDGKKISDVGHILTVENTNQLLGSLTDRQKEVADSLQKYMASQGAKWGNYVSVARFGEELFTNPNYYPINSDGRHLSATVEEHPSAASLYALLNMSFTKSRKEEANNRVVIYSIFDVFANHMASMAQYNAMALPILDALKWFNYQQGFIDDEGNKTVIANVREQMDRVYGVPEETRPGSGKQGYAETFIVNIIKAFNGTAAQGTPYDSFGLKSLHRYTIAQIAYNFRVVVQQPLAITRAGMLIDYKSIIKGMKLNPAVIKKNIRQLIENFGGYHLPCICIFAEFKSLPDRIQGFEPVFLSDFKNLHRHIV
jgi:DNA repair ATPase RecN